MSNHEQLYDLALKLAEQAHTGQVDKAGVPYINHPLAVAQAVESNDAKIVAVLHDVCEDSDITFDDLYRLGFPSMIIDAVIAITKRRDESYPLYLKRVAMNPIAKEVKIQDLLHNSDLNRIPQPTAKDLDRYRKYQEALEFLTEIQ